MTPKAPVWPDDGVILYDGVCVLCSAWVRFVATRDIAGRFRFAPIQTPYGRAMAQALGINPDEPDTNAVVLGEAVFRRSDAALPVLETLPGWRWVMLLRPVPRLIRDVIYSSIARNRYRIFGRNDVCDLGGASLAGRIVTRLPDAPG